MHRKYLETTSCLSLLLAAGLVMGASSPVLANPQDGVIAAGSATITSPTADKLDIHQSSQNVVIDWRSFDIAPNEHTQFHQPSSSATALNRVNTGNASQILGKLTANGNVIIVNQAGVMFGKDSVVDVNGLVATSSDITNTNFMNGNLTFDKSGHKDSAVVNHGTITAKDAGLVGLVAPRVTNSGTITAKLGKVQLASGDKFSVDLYGDGLMNITLSDDVSTQLIENSGSINTEGGSIEMTAAAGAGVVNNLINISGELKAPSITNKNGKITITGNGSSLINTGTIATNSSAAGTSAGTISIKAKKISQQGKITADSTSSGAAGSINIAFDKNYMDNQSSVTSAKGTDTKGGTITVAGANASTAFISGNYDVSSTGNTGGTATITADNGDLKLFGAHVTANGKTGGGTINIGGEYQGTGTTKHASTTGINFATYLSADATETGNGGQVIVWSDDLTQFAGHASAKGGYISGNGGLIELSSKYTLQVTANADTNASATNGNAGSLLLDPKNIIVATGGISGGISSFEFIDPNPDGGNFGTNLFILPSGNVFIIDTNDDLGAADAGAGYLFNGATGGLISTVIGSSTGDNIGSMGITTLTNGNLVLYSPDWDNGGATDAGALTWINGTTGLSGIIGSANSLVGSTTNDRVGDSYVTELSNGNFVARNMTWDNGGIVDAGAVTWVNGTTGLTGAISTSNSLYGTSAGDEIGWQGIWEVGNSNYVVSSPYWDNAAMADVGAYTWANGTTGITGAVSVSNSLYGGTAGDVAGYDTLTLLSNGNYLMSTTAWQTSGFIDVGAITWADGNTGITGVISAANSLVGSSDSDYIGLSYIHEVGNSNYLIFSGEWDNGGAIDAGAVTWGDGTIGVSGTISAANSLVGSTSYDQVGGGWAYEILRNGNYVLTSWDWDNGSAVDAGAVTFLDVNLGRTGVIDATNSLVGSSDNDGVGSIYTLDNGNYLVLSHLWDNGLATNAGALTWGSGTTGVSGLISSANSLIGSTTNDYVGQNVTVLTNSNYVTSNSNWDNGATANAGAVTWGNGATGTSGVVSIANSLVGTNTDDYVGSDGVLALTNGNYVVSSRFWANGAAFRAGAVTWGDGTTGISGAVSTANSLYGTNSYDYVGAFGAVALTNGNYVAVSSGWNSVRGAATWGNGLGGTIGAVSAANSVVGNAAGERLGFNVGFNTVTALDNGDYMVASVNWDDGVTADVGAIRLLDGTMASGGVMTSANALVGSSTGDFAGYFTNEFDNGNIALSLQLWDNGSAVNAGAITIINGTTGLTGVVSSANSLVGSSSNDHVGGNTGFLANGNLGIYTNGWDNGLEADAGAVTILDGITAITGVVSSANSIVGSSAGDEIGGFFQELANGTIVLLSNFWDDGAKADVGAVTFLDGTAGYSGVVSAANSLIGSTAGDRIGDNAINLSNDMLAITSLNWDDGANADAGAVTFMNMNAPLTGTINSGNSIIGPAANSGMYAFDEDPINETYIIQFLNLERVFAYNLNGSGASLSDYDSYGDSAASTITIDPTFITNVLNGGTSVTLQASNDITINDDIIVNNGLGDGGTLTFQAGRSILINADIFTDNGDLNIFANEDLSTGVVNAHRDAGAAVITMANGTSIDAGTGDVVIRLDDGTGKTNATAGDITLTSIDANTITATNRNATGDIILSAGGALTASATSGTSILLSSARNFINNEGASIFNLSGTARWLSYSTDPDDDTDGSLVADFTLFSCTYGGACGALGSGNGFLYSSADPSAPTPTPTPTPSTPSTTDVPTTVLYVSQTPPANIIHNGAETSDDNAVVEPQEVSDHQSDSLLNGWVTIAPALIKKLNLIWSQI